MSLRSLFKIGIILPAILSLFGAILLFYTKYTLVGIVLLTISGVVGTAQLMLVAGLVPPTIDLLIAKLTKKFVVFEFNDTRVVRRYLANYKSGFVWLDEEQGIGYIISSDNSVHFLDGIPVVIAYGTCGVACDIKALADLQQLSELGWNKDKLLEWLRRNNIPVLSQKQEVVP